MGGFEAVYNIVSPVLLCTIFIYIGKAEGYAATLIISIGIISSILRAIKVGWLKE